MAYLHVWPRAASLWHSSLSLTGFMSVRDRLAGTREDPRLATGGFFSQEPVPVEVGDTVGVVLMNHGGPRCVGDVEAFLRNRLMDPVAFRFRGPRLARAAVARLLARRRAREVSEAYAAVGGESPLNRHAREQADALERHLNLVYAPGLGVTFKTFVAMRYSGTSCEETAAEMADAGVDKVVLLPLHPHYASTTTGTSLAEWKDLEVRGTIPPRPTTSVFEYATHPKYVQALSERIDEGLRRFSPRRRDKVHVVFTAHGAPRWTVAEGRDPYCCLVHSTVQQVLDLRAEADPERSYHVSFHAVGVPGRGLRPATSEVVEEIVDEGDRWVLVVPLTFTSDHVETAYGLDVVERGRAEQLGVEQYEVAGALNCHSLLISALGEVTFAHLQTADARGDGAQVALPSALPRLDPACRTIRCSRCPSVREAADWSRVPMAPLPEVQIPTAA